MSDSAGEKTEDPSSKRKSSFRDEGNIPQSKDIGSAVVLFAAVVVVQQSGLRLAQSLISEMQFEFETIAIMSGADAKSVLSRIGGHSAMTYASIVAPFAFSSMAIGTIAGLVQTGANFTLSPLKFKFKFFNILSGLKRLLISLDTLQRIGLSLLKATAVGTALFIILRGHIPTIITLARVPLADALLTLGAVFLELILVGILSTVIIAAIDYAISKYRITQQLKMTKQEKKDEAKQAEGDPAVKRRMRQRMFEIGYNAMLNATADADVVVVNPTHYAVALAYDPAVDEAPRLLAKGKDHTAKKIRKIARENSIPIIANPPVARAIFDLARVDQELPGELYEMVARVLAYLYRMQGKRAA